VDVDRLLRELAAAERAFRKLEGDVQDTSRLATDLCWPAWRILLFRNSAPEALEAWWEKHGSRCPRCREAYRRVVHEGAPFRGAVPKRRAQVLRIFFDASWERAVPYAAHTPPRLDNTAAELPLVQYHRLRDVAEPSLRHVWCVSWDNAIYVLLVGPEEALAKWRDGADLTNSQGSRIGKLRQANAEVQELLAPGGTLEGHPALCLQCQATVVQLCSAPFTIPELLSGEVRLAPAESAPSPVQELVADLTSRNRVGRFLANLPDQTVDPADVLTLGFYLRLLHLQGRLTREDRKRLAALDWLPQDLSNAFRTSSESGGA